MTLLVAGMTAFAAGCAGDTDGQAVAQTQTPPPEVAVETMVPRGVTLTTILAGRTSAYLVAQVRPQVNGIIQKRLFREGSDVEAGRPLYKIDPSTYQAAHDNAQAALARAEANLVPTRLKAQRLAELAGTGAVSDQDNDDAQAAHGQAKAEVLAAKAALKAARINLNHTMITSPVAGRIGLSKVTAGALATANQASPLATVQQIDPIYVDVTQSSRDLLRLRRAFAQGRLTRSEDGQAKVKLFYEDDSPYPLEGSLQFADITVDEDTGVFTLRALFPNPNHDLLPGMYVRAVLEEGVVKQALLVPQRAVTRDPKGNPKAMVVLPDGTVEQRDLAVDRTVGDAWLVTAGLAPGDQVVVEGLQKIKTGIKVTTVEAQAPAQQ